MHKDASRSESPVAPCRQQYRGAFVRAAMRASEMKAQFPSGGRGRAGVRISNLPPWLSLLCMVIYIKEEPAMQISVSSTLTVYHDGQFWVGLAEHVEDGRYGAARIVFGAEPSNEEILRFVVNKWAKLSFFGHDSTEASEAAKALKQPAMSAKAHQALVTQREAMKQESAHARSRRRAEEADARFELCFRERGCPCPSFYDYAKSLRECRWGLAVQTGNFPPRRPYGPRRVRNRNKRWEALSGSPGSIGPFSSDRFAREVEQAVAVVPVLRPECLDLGRDTVGERFR